MADSYSVDLASCCEDGMVLAHTWYTLSAVLVSTFIHLPLVVSAVYQRTRMSPQTRHRDLP